MVIHELQATSNEATLWGTLRIVSRRERSWTISAAVHTFLRMCPILFFFVRKYFTFAERG